MQRSLYSAKSFAQLIRTLAIRIQLERVYAGSPAASARSD